MLLMKKKFAVLRPRMAMGPLRPATSWPSIPVNFWVASYVALLPYQLQLGPELRIGIADACIIGYFLSNLGRFHYSRRVWSFWHFAMVLAFCVGVFVTAIRAGSLSSYVYLNKGVGVASLFVAYSVVASEVQSWPQIRQIMRIFVASVTLQNLVAMAALMTTYFTGAGFRYLNPDNERLSGMMIDPNAYGGLLGVALLFSLIAAGGWQPLMGNFWTAICTSTLAAGVMLTFSRTAWMGLGAAWLLLVLMRHKAALRTIPAVAVGAPVVFWLLQERLISSERLISRPNTIEHRVQLLSRAWEYFANNPLLGVGLGGQRALEHGTIVHNTVLWILSDLGILGLLAFLGFMGWFFVRCYARYKDAPEAARQYAVALLASHGAMLTVAMGIEAFFQRHWWLLLALIAAAPATVRIARESALARPATVLRSGVPAQRPAGCGLVS